VCLKDLVFFGARNQPTREFSAGRGVFCRQCCSKVGTSITTHATFEFWTGLGTRVLHAFNEGESWSSKVSKEGERWSSKKNKAEDGGVADHNWRIEAWQRDGHTAFDPAVVAAKGVTLGLHTAAVMIRPKSEGPGPQTKTAAKKQAKDADASSKKSEISASAYLIAHA
jgi:hypothetical protein